MQLWSGDPYKPFLCDVDDDDDDDTNGDDDDNDDYENPVFHGHF